MAEGAVGYLWDVQAVAGYGGLALRREDRPRGGDLGIISAEVAVKPLNEICNEARVRGGILQNSI